jgi:hypothetical protein
MTDARSRLRSAVQSQMTAVLGQAKARTFGAHPTPAEGGADRLPAGDLPADGRGNSPTGKHYFVLGRSRLGGPDLLR